MKVYLMVMLEDIPETISVLQIPWQCIQTLEPEWKNQPTKLHGHAATVKTQEMSAQTKLHIDDIQRPL